MPKYENGGCFVVGQTELSHIIIYLTGGVIGRYGPKGAKYTGENSIPRALPVGPLLYKLFDTRN